MNDALYQEHILDHYQSPRNFGALDNATHIGAAMNPLCGDDLVMHAIVRDGVVEKIHFSGNGCAISIAAASLLTERLGGTPKKAIKKMTSEDMLALLKIPLSPVRMKCGFLALEAAKKLSLKAS